ncbi:CCA tRNA nucleotidyltransferase [bacterium]|nr:CCA tRNA nucleotidyltransferase [bacterium]
MEYIDAIKKDDILNQIIPLLEGTEACLVGGYIRDLIIYGTKSADRDIIIKSDNTREKAEEIAKKLGLYFVPLDEENQIYRLIFKDKINYIDIAKMLNNSFEEDIKRRDFTINAIAYDLKNEKIIDLTGGIEDIKNKRIREIDKQNFVDDSLRMLRLFRFISKTGFSASDELFDYIKLNHKRIATCSKERINTEIMKLFEGDYSAQTLLKMDETGMLEFLFPYLKEIKKIPPNTHHHLDLFHHLIETVSQIEKHIKEESQEIRDYFSQTDFGATNRISHLKFAAFFHDIGKPSTWTIEPETGRHRFIKHDDVGSKLIIPILKEYKFSKKQIDYIKSIIKYHIYPSALVHDSERNEKTTMRFFRKTEGFTLDLIKIARADRLSARGEAVSEEMVKNNLEKLEELKTSYLKSKEEIKPLEKLLDGFEIMEILNIERGKELGRIISELKEAQISGEVTTKKEATEFIKKLNQPLKNQ